MRDGLFVIFKVALIIFLIEGAFMLVLPYLELPSDAWAVALIDATALTLVGGICIYYFVIKPFIEARNRSEHELRVSERFRAALINNTADGIIAIGQDGTIRVFNPAATRMFGYEQAEVIGKNISILIAPEMREAHDGYLRVSNLHAPRILGNQRAIAGQRKDGSAIPLEISVSAMESDRGRMFIGVCHDTTERKQVVEVVNNARRQAEIANKAKSEFLANMSHELRTPLNAIIGFSEIIKDAILGRDRAEQYEDYAGNIHEAGLHLLDLINGILDLSKIEAGGEELHEEDVEISEVVHTVEMLVKGRAAKSGVALQLDLHDDLPMLHADQRKLKQILMNILTNGIKFTKAGGSVTLKIWCTPESGYVFQIVDTGIGMAVEDIPKALKPFGQVDSELNRQYEGTGLGLPLTKHLVEMHGGSFDLQSEIGVGTTVTVRFPAQSIVAEEPLGQSAA